MTIKYPYDINGNQSTNLIKNELQVFPEVQNGFSAIFPKLAPFHLKDLKIKTLDGVELNNNVDYKLGWYYEGLSSNENAPDIYFAIVLKNLAFLKKQVLLEYYTVGDIYIMDELDWSQFAKHQTIDPVERIWDDLEDRPNNYSTHPDLIDLDEAVGYSKFVGKLEDLFEKSNVVTSRIKRMLDSHIHDEVKPHNIDLDTLGLTHLKQIRKASIRDLEEGTDNSKYVPPLEFRLFLNDNYIRKGASVSVSLKGPTEYYQGETVSWKITNFDSFSNYSANIDDGTVTIENDVVTADINSNAITGQRTFTITRDGIDRKIAVKVKLRAIVKPVVFGVENDATDVNLYLGLTTSSFTTIPPNTGNLTGIVYQISDTEDFTNLLTDQLHEDVTPFFVSLPEMTRLYLRAKHKGDIIQESTWSDTINFITTDIQMGPAGWVSEVWRDSSLPGGGGQITLRVRDGIHVPDVTGRIVIDGLYQPEDRRNPRPDEIVAVGTEFKVIDKLTGEVIAKSGYKEIDWQDGSHSVWITRPDGTRYSHIDRKSTRFAPFNFNFTYNAEQQSPYGVDRPDLGVVRKIPPVNQETYDAIIGKEFIIQSRFRLSSGGWSGWSQESTIQIVQPNAAAAYIDNIDYDDVSVSPSGIEIVPFSTVFTGFNINAKADVFERLEVQASRSVLFDSLLVNETFTNQGPIDLDLPRDTLVYVRCRYVGKYTGVGEWVGSRSYSSEWYTRFTTNNVLPPTLELPDNFANHLTKEWYNQPFTGNGDEVKLNFLVRANIHVDYLFYDRPWANGIIFEMRDGNGQVVANSGLKSVMYANYQTYRGSGDSQYWQGVQWHPIARDWSNDPNTNFPHSDTGPYGSGSGRKEPTSESEQIGLSGNRYSIRAKIRLTDDEWSDWSEPLFVDIAQITQMNRMTGHVNTIKRQSWYEPGSTWWIADDNNWPPEAPGYQSGIGRRGYIRADGQYADAFGNPFGDHPSYTFPDGTTYTWGQNGLNRGWVREFEWKVERIEHYELNTKWYEYT